MERISFQNLHALCAVHQAGSITEAARSLGSSQPAVTRAIRHLEQEVGFALLDRHARGVVFTARGEAFLRHALLVRQLEQEAGESLARWHAGRTREVRLAVSDVPIAALLPTALGLLKASVPEVRLRIVEAAYPEVLRHFRQGLIDVAVGPVPTAALAERFRVETLMEAPLVVAVGHSNKLRNVNSLAQLNHLGWVAQRAVDAPDDTLFEIFSHAGVEVPRKVLICESISTALQFIEEEGFAGLVPQHLALEACRAGRLRLLTVREPLPCRSLGLFHPIDRPLDASGRAVYSSLRMAAQRKSMAVDKELQC